MKEKIRNFYVNYIFFSIVGFFAIILALATALSFYPMKWLYDPKDFHVVLTKFNKSDLVKSLKKLSNFQDIFEVNK